MTGTKISIEEKFLLVLFSFIIGIVATYGNFDTSEKAPLYPAYETSDIAGIVETSQSSHLRFTRYYAGHKFSGTMELYNISKIQETYIVSFKKDSFSSFPEVMCRADRNFATDPINQHVGGQVYVSGTINYAFMSSIALNDCKYATAVNE